VGAGSGFTLQGEEHAGALYVEDEDNFYSVVKQPSSAYLTSYYAEDENNVGSYRKLGSQYNADTDVYTRSGGVTCYETSSVSVTVQGVKYGGTLYYKSGSTYYALSSTMYYAGESKTYYTRSNGAYRYTTNKVDTPLYTDGGVGTYPLYTEVSKNLYEAGSTVTYPSYKKYAGKLYDAGQAATLSPAEVTTQNVTALTT
jgi:hypothetical protein